MHDEWKVMAKAGKWMEMMASVTDEMLETFALIGTPEEVASKMKERCGGKMDRVSPVIYQPDTELLKALLKALRAEF